MSLTESVKRSRDEAFRVFILKSRKSGGINLHHGGVNITKDQNGIFVNAITARKTAFTKY
jgi:hypothetical protein